MTAASETHTPLRADLALIASLIPARARVLDIGCGDGALLEHLTREKGIDARGIELSQAGVNACVAHGLSVIQGDADTDLAGYPDGAFDFVILSQTIQATRNPRTVLSELLRIGRRAIVSLPNFGHWRLRLSLALRGRMPQTQALPFGWYDTPNIHLCTMADFTDLTKDLGVTIERAFALNQHGHTLTREVPPFHPWSNLLAEGALFLMRKD